MSADALSLALSRFLVLLFLLSDVVFAVGLGFAPVAEPSGSLMIPPFYRISGEGVFAQFGLTAQHFTRSAFPLHELSPFVWHSSSLAVDFLCGSGGVPRSTTCAQWS